MHLNRIEQFIAVVDAGSIRAAARQLDVSQPALTRSLQQLEEELGVQLMRRSVRGVSLTVAGSAFLARARVAEAELRLGAEEARRSVASDAGLVTVGLGPAGASLLLPEFVTTLLQLRPATRIRLVELSPGTLLPLLREAGLDMAVGGGTGTALDAGLRYRPLFEVQMRVAVRTGHPLSGARSLRELAQSSWLSMAAPGIPDILSQSFLAAGLPTPVPAVHCGSHSIALDAIAASDMIGLLPPALLRSWMAAGRLVELPLTKPLAPLRIGLYTRADSPPSAAAKVAAQVIVNIARRLASTGELRSAEPVAGSPPTLRRRIAANR